MFFSLIYFLFYVLIYLRRRQSQEYSVHLHPSVCASVYTSTEVHNSSLSFDCLTVYDYRRECIHIHIHIKFKTRVKTVKVNSEKHPSLWYVGL